MTLSDQLDKLPLFATDQQLAVAIVGKTRAALWVKTVIPQLERKGFPRIDPLHDGRPVPLVKKFYDSYFGITAGFAATAPDGEERLDAWRSKRSLRNERKPQLGLDARCQKALLFMAGRPEIRTQHEIPDAGTHTMERLAAAGAIAEGKRDAQGDRTWKITDLGAREAKKIMEWHHGRRV